MTMKDKITKSLGEVPESKNGIYFHIFKDTDEVVVFVDKTSKFYMDTPSDNLDVCLEYNRIFLKGVDRKAGYFLDIINKDIWCITWVEKESSPIETYYDHIESVIYQIIMREKYELKYKIMNNNDHLETIENNSNTIETMLKNMDISYGVYKGIPYTIKINCITSGVSVTFYYLAHKGCIHKKKMNNIIIDICRNHNVNYIDSYDGYPNKIIYNNVLGFGFNANDTMKTKDIFLRLKVYESIVKEYIDIIKNENNGENTMEDKINSFEITENKDVILKNARRETILEIPARIAKILSKNYTKLTEGKIKPPYSVGILNPDLLNKSFDFSKDRHAEVGGKVTAQSERIARLKEIVQSTEEHKTEFLYSPKSSNVNSISERDSSELDSRIYFENDQVKEYAFKYKMYSYLIKSIGSHPCVYIILDKNIQDIIDVKNNINVHGGVTYTDEYMFGWDYAHFGDIYYDEPDIVSWKNKQNKAYTLEELKRDAEDAIDQIIDLRYSIGKFKISEESNDFTSLPKIFINEISYQKYLESCLGDPYVSSFLRSGKDVLKEYYIKKYNMNDDKLRTELECYIIKRLGSIVLTPALSYFPKDIILKEANKLSKHIEKEIEDKFNIK